jgi:hypothetical protein
MRPLDKAVFLDRDGVIKRKAAAGSYVTDCQIFRYSSGGDNCSCPAVSARIPDICCNEPERIGPAAWCTRRR